MLSGTTRYLPLLAVGLIISVVMVGAYLAVGLFPTDIPQATWRANPVSITFSATIGIGSATDSFTCSPSATFLNLIVHTSTTRVALSVSPSGFAACGATPSVVTLTVKCLLSPAALCRGSFDGLVQIRQPPNYRDIPNNLAVTIVVN